MQDEHETVSLIGANKVEGTKVFNRSGEELGQIHEIMIDKLSGKVAYAVMSFGGVLGLGEKYSPLPWSSLKYDTELKGYVSDLDKEIVKNAPEYDIDSPAWSNAYVERVRRHYAEPYRA
jgi:sporulation protein YlmC with PRC-barrel domain